MKGWWRVVASYGVLACLAVCVQNEWRPLDSGLAPSPIESEPRHFITNADPCTLHKVSLHQDNYYQYVQYKTRLPDLKEFTICTWHKFYNHSRDHPLFSYALKERPREILSWVENTVQSSYYNLAIGGHTLYRINYPVRLHKWYHSCQSWNGKNGEWQLWVNSERVGRGFYNIIVGRVIKGGGVAITGQEQRAYGGGFPDGGLMGEVTLVQVYKAALTAGKAYTDHKHHHAHKFHHEDMLGEDDPEMAGQATPQQQVPPMQPGQPFAPTSGGGDPMIRGGQLVPRLPVEELVIRPQQPQQQQGQSLNLLSSSDIMSPYSSQSIRLFKRGSNHTNEKRDTVKAKRTLDQTTFGLVPGVDLSGFLSGDSYILGKGPHDDSSVQKLESANQMEPAEWEVRSIMGVCSGCATDPFRKANVLSWRETSKKVFGGALYLPASPQCHEF